MELSDEASIDTNDVYQMVESIAYFEAYRHVLVGLQEVTKLPFQVASFGFLAFIALHHRGKSAQARNW